MKDSVAIEKYRKAIEKAVAGKEPVEQRRLLKGAADAVTKLASKKSKWRPFAEARKYVRSLGLTRHVEWAQWSKTSRPKDIPASPWTVYPEWNGMKDWLGDSFSRKEYESIRWRPFEDAREFARSLGLKKEKEWRVYCKGGMPGLPERPIDVPVYPQQAYREQYAGMKDWLGYDPKDKHRPFEEAREYVRTLGILTVDEWRVYCAAGKLPEDIPSNPQRVYRGLGWVDWWDWLGKEKKTWSRKKRIRD